LIYRLLILLGLALVGVAVWLTLSPRQAEPVTAQNSGPAAPDLGYSASDASMVETGADGLPLYTLQARQIQQDPQTNIIHLSTVHMTRRDSSGGELQVRSDRANAQQDSAQIDLSGHVNVTVKFASSDQPLYILTDPLHVDTHTEIIRTSAPVTLDWAGTRITATGLVANLKEQRLKLESQVHGQVVR
jgi:lipopolysaccharide export system protein LptC